jgi:hypothetical protein
VRVEEGIMSRYYIVTIGGSSWSRGPQHEAKTIKDARRIAVEYGNTADLAVVEIAAGRDKGKMVAAFKRDTDGDGMTWQRVVPPWLD